MVHASATVGCLLALCLLAPLPGAAGFVPDVHAAVGLGIVANPTSGFAPLLVDFALISQNGTPPSVSWAFGDGSTLNGSGSAFDAPSHVYVENGEYLCTVTAHWPAGPLVATVPIQVFASNLSAMVVASPLNGTAPLTVQFNATPIGGTGTYLAYVWNFDDGGSGSGLDVRYTFELPGTYHVSFMVTDSSEHNASTSVAVDVTQPYVPPPNSTAPHNNSTGGSNLGRSGSAGPAWTTTDALVISLLAAGLAILTIATGWVLWQRRRRAGEALVVSHRRIDPLVLPQVPGTAPSVPEPPRPTVSLAAAIPAAREVPSGEPSGLAGSRRLTYQLVRHLARLPRLGPGDLPGREWTQAGIAESVGAGQSAVSRILRRLIGAGVVAVETTHLRGTGRRVRVYVLTDRGERLGRALREGDSDARRPPP